MRKIIAITQVTLDGVMQAPGGPEEDPRNGFTHGGWAMPFVDAAAKQVIDEIIAGEFDMLLGRRTYEIFATYWPHRGDSPIGKVFNKATKYVVTRTLDHLDWENSQHIGGDVLEQLRRLKASDGPALQIWGSSELLQTLIAADLSTNIASGSFRWCSAKENACSKMASRHVVSLWLQHGARQGASSSTPTGLPVPAIEHF
jgi:dihydrofolate reductase